MTSPTREEFLNHMHTPLVNPQGNPNTGSYKVNNEVSTEGAATLGRGGGCHGVLGYYEQRRQANQGAQGADRALGTCAYAIRCIYTAFQFRSVPPRSF